MIVTLQTNSALKPALSVNGGIVKLDMGALLLEMDKETFKTMMANLVTQAAENEIHILVWE